MLTIQPNLANNYNRTTSFGNYRNFPEVIDLDEADYEEIPYGADGDTCDFSKEKAEAKKELDIWKQTKANVDTLAKTTESVPVVRTGTKILSGITAVAIGWGGLRWGSVGTLEVCSKMLNSKLGKAAKQSLESAGTYISKKYDDFGTFLKDTKIYKGADKKVSNWKEAFAKTTVGKTLADWKQAIKNNSIYQKTVSFKNDTVNYFKNLNYKRVFVEGMGIAGGGAATINVLGGKTVDGRKQHVESDDNGNYYVNGRQVRLDEGDSYAA